MQALSGHARFTHHRLEARLSQQIMQDTSLRQPTSAIGLRHTARFSPCSRECWLSCGTRISCEVTTAPCADHHVAWHTAVAAPVVEFDAAAAVPCAELGEPTYTTWTTAGAAAELAGPCRHAGDAQVMKIVHTTT